MSNHDNPSFSFAVYLESGKWFYRDEKGQRHGPFETTAEATAALAALSEAYEREYEREQAAQGVLRARIEKGTVLPPGTQIVSCELPGGSLAVKVRCDAEQLYAVFTNGVATGEHIDLAEVRRRRLPN